MNKYILKYNNNFEFYKSAKNQDGSSAKDIEYWRTYLFSRILYILFPISAITVIPSVFMCIKESMILLGVADFIAFFIVAMVTFNNKLKISFRKKLFVITLFILAILLITEMGIIGPGFIYLLGVSILFTVLISSRAGYASIVANAIIILVYFLIIRWGLISNNSFNEINLAPYLTISINFLLVNIFSVFAISVLIRGLNKSLTQNIVLKNKAEESEKKFKNLFNSVSIPLCYVKESGEIETFNKRFTELFGYTINDIPTLNEWWILAYPDETYRSWVIDNWNKAVQNSIEQGTDIESDIYNVSCKNGEVRQIIIAGITVETDFLATFIDVTEQEKVANQILLEKEFSDKVIDALPGIFYLFDKNGKFVRWNKTLSDLSGFTYEEIAQKSPLNFIAPYHHEQISEAIQTTFVEGKVFVEADFLSYKSENIPFYFTGIRIELNGEPHLLGVGIDITERKKAEERLKESEKRLSKAITDSPFPVMIHAEGGEVIQISNSWSEATGYSINEIATMGNWLEQAYGMKKESVEKVIENLYKSDEKTREGEFEISCKNGERKIWDFSSSPIGKTSDGRKLIMSMANDVTERKHAEEKIQRSEANLNIILDSMPFGSVIIGTDRKVRSVNKTALQMMGYQNSDEVIGSTCYQTFCPSCDDSCPVWDLHETLDKADKVLITKENKRLPILKSAIPVILDNEEVLLETFIDISNLKKLETEKDKALQNLQERIKEIRCLYQINEIFRLNYSQGVKEQLQQAVSLIPHGWKVPEKTCAKVVFDELELQTGNYIETKYFLEENIWIDKRKRGSVSVRLTDGGIQDKPFLEEEKELLKEIAFNIAQFLDKSEHEKALVESEEKFRELIQNSPLPKIVLDLENNVELINKSFEEILGYSKTDIPNIDNWWPLAYPDLDYREEIENIWDEAMAEAIENERPSKPVEAKIRCKNGKDRFFSVIGNKIGSKFLIIYNDLTERILAEEERDRFFTVSLDLLCIAGTDGYFKRLNPAWQEVLGWSVEELTAKPFLDFVHPEDIGATLKEVEKLADGRATLHFTNRYRCKNGAYKWLTWNTAPFGDILYAVATDITDLRMYQDKVAELNNRLNFALEGGEVGVWEWDLDTGETIWDNRMEAMFGLEPNTFNGTFEAFKERLHPDDVGITEEAITKALSGEKDYDIIYRSKWKNGEIHFINAKADVIKNSKQEKIKMIGICFDVTELKTAEQKLLKIADELTRSNQELEQFAYVASHDLQQPLRMVASYTQLLEKRYKDKIDEKANKYIHYAVDGANRMQTLINDLLSFSRVSTKGEEFKVVDTNEAIQDSISNLSMLVKENNAQITFDKLPEINGDASQIVSLFQNLIENGIKFNGGKTPEIHISAKKKENKWIFSVKDNGIGIDPKFQEKIFVIFQRLHTRDEYEGTGIGLALCKRIVNRHGGEIWFKSDTGKGTTFYFSINMD